MGSRVETEARITVRPLEVDDLPRVQEIDHNTSGRLRAATYEDPLGACLGGDLGVSYVAEIDGEVVGFIFGWLMDSFWVYHEGARIEMIGVDPTHRYRGVGRRLLDAFFHGCKEKGVREIHMLVRTFDPDLRAFLSKVNFQPAELIDYVCQTSTGRE